jgi:hypothetical protein
VDGSSNPKLKIKEIKIGDVVRFMRYDADAYSVPAYGTVVKITPTRQIYLFPAVEVYVWGPQHIQTISISAVEVISRA